MNTQNPINQITFNNPIMNLIVTLLGLSLPILGGLLINILTTNNSKPNKLLAVWRLVVWLFIVICLTVIFGQERGTVNVFQDRIFFSIFVNLIVGMAIASILDIILDQTRWWKKIYEFNKETNNLREKASKDTFCKSIDSAYIILEFSNKKRIKINDKIRDELFWLIEEIFRELENWFPSIDDPNLYSLNELDKWQPKLIKLAEYVTKILGQIINRQDGEGDGVNTLNNDIFPGLKHRILNAKALFILAKGNFYLWKKSRNNTFFNRLNKESWNSDELNKYFEYFKKAKENLDLGKCLIHNNSNEIRPEEIILFCCQFQAEIAQVDQSYKSFEDAKNSLNDAIRFVESNKNQPNFQVVNKLQRLCYFHRDLGNIYREIYKKSRANIQDNLSCIKEGITCYENALDLAQKIGTDEIKLIKLSCYDGLGELLYLLGESLKADGKSQEARTKYIESKNKFDELLQEVKNEKLELEYKAYGWLSRISFQLEGEQSNEAYRSGINALKTQTEIQKSNEEYDLSWQNLTLNRATKLLEEEVNCNQPTITD